MVLKAFVERYIAESKSIAQQCEALTWEFVDSPTVIIPTL